MDDLFNRANRLFRAVKGSVEDMFQPEAEKAQKAFQEANKLLREGNIEDAIDRFEDAILADPEFAPAYTWRGIACLQVDDFEAARQDFMDALKRDSNDGRAHYGLGLALAGKGHPDQALIAFERAVKITPDFAPIYQSRAEIHEEAERWEEAARDYQEALRLDPAHLPGHLKLATLLRKLKRFDEAQTSLQSLMIQAPNFYKTYLLRGQIFFEQGDGEMAIKNLTHSISLNPEIAQSYLLRGVIYLNDGALDLAEADFDKSLTLKPEDAKSYAYLAEIAAQREQHELMFEHLAMAKELGANILSLSKKEAFQPFLEDERLKALL